MPQPSSSGRPVLLEPLAMQLRGAWRAARRAIAQRRKIGVGEQRAREKSHIYRSGPAGEERDFVVDDAFTTLSGS